MRNIHVVSFVSMLTFIEIVSQNVHAFIPNSLRERKSLGMFGVKKKSAKKKKVGGGGGGGGGFGNSSKKVAKPSVDLKKNAIDRALVGMSALQSPSLTSTNASLGRLLDASKKLVLAPSKVSDNAGMGLFLAEGSEPIEAGDIVTFYAVHGLGYDCDDGNGDSSSLLFDGENEDYVLNLLGSRPLLSTPSGRPVNFGEGAYLMINVDPTRVHIAGWLGQMINDGAALLSGSTESDILGYYKNSELARNVVLVPFGMAPLVASVATRRITSGSELLTSYGCQYWLEAQSKLGMDIDEEGITNNVRQQAKGVAMEVMAGAKSAALKYNEIEGRTLASVFAAARDKGADDVVG